SPALMVCEAHSMSKILLILALFAPPLWADDVQTCEGTMVAGGHIELAVQAAALFREAERELAIDVQFRGVYSRPISPDLAERLRRVSRKLEEIPGQHHEYTQAFAELAEVLAGEKSVLSYGRREQVGYSPD